MATTQGKEDAMPIMQVQENAMPTTQGKEEAMAKMQQRVERHTRDVRFVIVFL